MMRPVWLNLPNLLTLVRLAALPWAVHAILAQNRGLALVLVFGAALTDTLDGTVARHFGQSTAVGAWFDPVVDKIFLSAVLIALWVAGAAPGWLVALVFVRDAAILGGTAFAWAAWGMRRFPPSAAGKASTFLLMGYVLALLFESPVAALFPWPVAAVATGSALHYFWRGWRWRPAAAPPDPAR